MILLACPSQTASVWHEIYTATGCQEQLCASSCTSVPTGQAFHVESQIGGMKLAEIDKDTHMSGGSLWTEMKSQTWRRRSQWPLWSSPWKLLAMTRHHLPALSHTITLMFIVFCYSEQHAISYTLSCLQSSTAQYGYEISHTLSCSLSFVIRYRCKILHTLGT